jgi:hypothetical protein
LTIEEVLDIDKRCIDLLFFQQIAACEPSPVSKLFESIHDCPVFTSNITKDLAVCLRMLIRLIEVANDPANFETTGSSTYHFRVTFK